MPLSDAEQLIENDNARLRSENQALRARIAQLESGDKPATSKRERDPDAYAKAYQRAREQHAERRSISRPSSTGGTTYVTYN